jgi:hypothetical protein
LQAARQRRDSAHCAASERASATGLDKVDASTSPSHERQLH